MPVSAVPRQFLGYVKAFWLNGPTDCNMLLDVPNAVQWSSEDVACNTTHYGGLLRLAQLGFPWEELMLVAG